MAPPVHFDVTCFFEENAIPTGYDTLDAEMSIRVGDRAVVAALLLIFGDYLHDYFFKGMVRRFANNRAGDHGRALRGRRTLSGFGQRDGNKECERKECYESVS